MKNKNTKLEKNKSQASSLSNKQPPIKVVKDTSNLPMKDLFRIDEVADYFQVTERTIRLWLDHGHLKPEKIVGIVRISRASILKCRFRK